VTSEKNWIVRMDRIARWVALVGGGTMLVGLMALIVVDVGLRYGFSAPIYGARDVGKLMLLTMLAFSVAYSARTGGQVAIELFSQWMGPRAGAWRDIGIRLIAVVMVGILTVRLWTNGSEASGFGEASLALEIGHGPFYYILALGMALYAAVLVLEIVLAWRRGPIDYHHDHNAHNAHNASDKVESP
jgi:TRAP-type C4-dicarboxylate transport system permease small subunit